MRQYLGRGGHGRRRLVRREAWRVLERRECPPGVVRRGHKEGLGETEVLNVRMGKGGVAEHALWNGDVVATEEGFVASSASGFFAGMKGAENGFAIGDIEGVAADGTGHNCNRCLCMVTKRRDVKKAVNQFF